MNDFQKDIELCVRALRKGGSILYPTDTIWGLGCDAQNQDAVNKIIRLKKRSVNKSMIILLAEIQEIRNHTDIDPGNVLSCIKNQKNPTTIIYPQGKNVAPDIIAKDGSIGIRIVQDFFCQSLIKAFGGAIVSTSANISGDLSPSCFHEINEEIKKNVDYIVRYRQTDESKATASRILRYESDGSITIIRP